MTSANAPVSNNANEPGQFLLFLWRIKGEDDTKVFIRHRQVAVTFVAISNGIEVDVVLLVTDEE